MIPNAEVVRLFSVKRDAAIMGLKKRPLAGAQILRDGYSRCMRLDDEGLAWGYRLALLYSLALSCYASEFLPSGAEPASVMTDSAAPDGDFRPA